MSMGIMFMNLMLVKLLELHIFNTVLPTSVLKITAILFILTTDVFHSYNAGKSVQTCYKATRLNAKRFQRRPLKLVSQFEYS